mgnify:FL=1
MSVDLSLFAETGSGYEEMSTTVDTTLAVEVTPVLETLNDFLSSDQVNSVPVLSSAMNDIEVENVSSMIESTEVTTAMEYMMDQGIDVGPADYELGYSPEVKSDNFVSSFDICRVTSLSDILVVAIFLVLLALMFFKVTSMVVKSAIRVARRQTSPNQDSARINTSSV